MAHQQYAGDHGYEAGDTITDQDLDEREHVDRLIAPVARLVEKLHEMRPPDSERPEVTAREPDAQKQTQNGVWEARRLGRLDIASVLVRPVHVVQLLVASTAHL